MGRANPYGVYDCVNNDAWVSVGIDHDTASFAVEALRRWWYTVTPAMEAGIADHVWSIDEIVALLK